MQKAVSFRDKNDNQCLIEIEIKDGNLSMMGECDHSSGQCQDSIIPRTEAQAKLLEIWDRWHLNDMHAGCIHQRAAKWDEVRINPKELPDTIANSDEKGIIATWVRKKEHPKGLLCAPCPECGYKYGTEWKREELPADIVETIDGLLVQIIADNGNSYIDMKAYRKNQAAQFLRSAGTTFQAVFVKYDKYFEDDKDKRDIYRITLTRGKREWSFNFGQSIAASGKYILYYTAGKYESGYRFQESELKAVRMAFYGFGKVYELNKDYAVPSAYDVLSCITKRDPGTLGDFCSEMGYDADSKKAENVYNGVITEWKNVQMIFKDEEIEKLQDIR
jgi:hypothetical protein